MAAASPIVAPGSVRPLLWALACGALGMALALHYEVQPPAAWAWFVVATVALPLAALLPTAWAGAAPPLRNGAALPLLAGAALVLDLWMLLTVKLSWLEPQHAQRRALVALLLLAGGALTAVGLNGPTRLDRARIAAICLCHAALGVIAVQATLHPWNDIYTFHESSFAELLAGRSPYGHYTRNVYRGLHTLAFYGEGLLTDDQALVKIGFPYPPLQLGLSLLGQRLLGDYRFLQGLALTASGALLYLARPGRAAAAGAALLWFSPRLLHTLEAPATEPMVVFFLSLTLFASLRAPRLLWLALGGLFAIKQYGVLLAPLAFFLLQPGPARREETLALLLRASLFAALLTLPMALWSPRGFLDDVVLFQVRQPFRIDSLSYAARWAMATGAQPPAALGFAALALGLWLGARAPDRGAAAFAAGGALAFFAFFAFAKQAFANYYLVVHALACWALALAGPVGGPTEDRAVAG